MPLPRSFLYVPANRDKFLDKAMGLPADAFIFDLEDSVPAAGEGKRPGGRQSLCAEDPGPSRLGARQRPRNRHAPKPISTP